jgi:hypothetical protein
MRRMLSFEGGVRGKVQFDVEMWESAVGSETGRMSKRGWTTKSALRAAQAYQFGKSATPGKGVNGSASSPWPLRLCDPEPEREGDLASGVSAE